ncbi:ankyrin repeat domain-containing protein [Paraflavitalea speifideaquila]|uniref:ankyrin repeat domain-containing protein n=1 Tax=Paraflavitalea speifideaquila TaxID=3076558 RepID=UPI0028EBDF9B|nr:ankyrin repeat domain-containing protein [Paraflavitalea speifideiaquila]
MEAGFIWACEFGHPPVIDYLIGQGLDPNIAVNGMYGLHWALIGGHLEVIQLLLQHRVSLEARNQYGGNAIGCAVWSVCNSDGVYRWPEREVDYMLIIETLLRAGASIEQGMLAWLAQQNDMPASTRQSLDTLFRQYGAIT